MFQPIQYTFRAMLQHLSIRNYATVQGLDVDFRPGMSALTGETGAGKSIIVGALGLALGDRADKTVVRTGAKRTEITAEFDVSKNDAADAWLEDNQLQGDAANSCLVRRVVGADGRSRAFINDSPVTMASLQQLGALLVDIVSQQEHQSLLQRATQLSLLDDYCVEHTLLEELRSLHRRWQTNQRDIARLRGDDDEGRVQLLTYQLDELRELAAEDGETGTLEQEHRRLSGAEQALAALAGAVQDIADHEQFNALGSLRRALQLLGDLQGDSNRIANAMELLESACIQIDEAAADLRAATDEFPIDPERLSQVDDRLGRLHDMARKHKVKPAELAQLTRSLQEQLQAIHGREEELQRLGDEDLKLRERYAEVAGQVGKQRRKGAGPLSREIEKRIARLGMGDAGMEIRFEPLASDAINARGLERVEFLVSTNPGQEPGPLSKIASGGELSRISLAIRVVTAQTSQTPCLVFDEVDVGIGGGVAAQVGALLQTLGDSAQILCVTHQPQVASRAHRQYSVDKSSDGASAQTSISELDEDARVLELARMLAGAEFSDASLAHARQMLAGDQDSC
ncbi:MAG: DNA repair protein RecN [Gammaproteobacteria bacterium]|nr:DNA repair protein RecN [Gammaproteobacteria bacterium]MCY3689088.1 DNA repair protein RecN [Gammaproteobacteria bacterium]